MPSNLLPSSSTRNSDSTLQHTDVHSKTTRKNSYNQVPFSAVVSSNWCWHHSCHWSIKWQMSNDWVFHSVNVRDPKCRVMGIRCPFLHPKRTLIYAFLAALLFWSIHDCLWCKHCDLQIPETLCSALLKGLTVTGELWISCSDQCNNSYNFPKVLWILPETLKINLNTVSQMCSG